MTPPAVVCCLGLNEATYRHPFPNVGVCLCYANSPPCRAREASMTTIFAEFFVEWVCVGVVVCIRTFLKVRSGSRGILCSSKLRAEF